jgi:hypothetical protein
MDFTQTEEQELICFSVLKLYAPSAGACWDGLERIPI